MTLEERKQWNQRKREKLLEQKKQYRLANKDKIKASDKIYNDTKRILKL